MPQAGVASPADVAGRRAAGSLQAFDGVSALIISYPRPHRTAPVAWSLAHARRAAVRRHERGAFLPQLLEALGPRAPLGTISRCTQPGLHRKGTSDPGLIHVFLPPVGDGLQH